ncbi:hypothetical protein [Cohnella sp. GCM10027633]|uniref:hypothetical protein n=1 Tax=unclassified Cohnella TaxID=2636738 RepID=UPI0036259C84
MGEEKPDEELMGKRKSSPRLSPTPLGAGTIIVTRAEENIRNGGKKVTDARLRDARLHISIFCAAADYGNITDSYESALQDAAQNDQGLNTCESYPDKPKGIR